MATASPRCFLTPEELFAAKGAYREVTQSGVEGLRQFLEALRSPVPSEDALRQSMSSPLMPVAKPQEASGGTRSYHQAIEPLTLDECIAAVLRLQRPNRELDDAIELLYLSDAVAAVRLDVVSALSPELATPDAVALDEEASAIACVANRFGLQPDPSVAASFAALAGRRDESPALSGTAVEEGASFSEAPFLPLPSSMVLEPEEAANESTLLRSVDPSSPSNNNQHRWERRRAMAALSGSFVSSPPAPSRGVGKSTGSFAVMTTLEARVSADRRELQQINPVGSSVNSAPPPVAARRVSAQLGETLSGISVADSVSKLPTATHSFMQASLRDRPHEVSDVPLPAHNGGVPPSDDAERVRRIYQQKLRARERQRSREAEKGRPSESQGAAPTVDQSLILSVTQQSTEADPFDRLLWTTRTVSQLGPLATTGRFYTRHGDESIYATRSKPRSLGERIAEARAAAEELNATGDLDALLAEGWRPLRSDEQPRHPSPRRKKKPSQQREVRRTAQLLADLSPHRSQKGYIALVTAPRPGSSLRHVRASPLLGTPRQSAKQVSRTVQRRRMQQSLGSATSL